MFNPVDNLASYDSEINWCPMCEQSTVIINYQQLIMQYCLYVEYNRARTGSGIVLHTILNVHELCHTHILTTPCG